MGNFIGGIGVGFIIGIIVTIAILFYLATKNE